LGTYTFINTPKKHQPLAEFKGICINYQKAQEFYEMSNSLLKEIFPLMRKRKRFVDTELDDP
jgi:hypothetical protein